MQIGKVVAAIASVSVVAALVTAPPAVAQPSPECRTDKGQYFQGEKIIVTFSPGGGYVLTDPVKFSLGNQTVTGTGTNQSQTAELTALTSGSSLEVLCTWSGSGFPNAYRNEPRFSNPFTVDPAPAKIESCTLEVLDPDTSQTGISLVKPRLKVTWQAKNTTSVDVAWLVDGASVGTTSVQTGNSATTAIDPSRNARNAAAGLTPVDSLGQRGPSFPCKPVPIPSLPAPPTDFTVAFGSNGSISATPDAPSKTGYPNVNWTSNRGGAKIFDESISPSNVSCSAGNPVTFTYTLTPTSSFLSFYSPVVLSKTITPSCVREVLGTLLSDPAFDQNALQPTSTGVVAAGGAFSDPGLSADAQFTDWVGRSFTSPFDFSLVVPTAAIPAGTEARCLVQVTATNPSVNLAITASPLPGAYTAADKTYCETTYPVTLASSASSNVPPGGSSSTTPTAGPSSSGSGSSSGSSPASTGGGGASSASNGATGRSAAGGPGSNPAVRTFSAPCLADGTLYTYMAGSVGSSFAMAPDLRNRETPVSFVVTRGSLPPGIQLDKASGVVFGVPTRTSAGITPITITATNADGTTETAAFRFPVDDPHHSVSYPVRVIAGVGDPIDIFHHGKGNSGPTSYSLVCGTLPTGLTLDPSSGVIAGTPTEQVQFPIPLRIRQTDQHGWVEASMMLLVDGTTNPWLSYPHHATVAKGTTRTIRPTVVGLPGATYELQGTLPAGLSFDSTSGAISGKATKLSKKSAEVSVLAVLPDGSVATSDTLLITVRKRAIPMAVTAVKATKELKQGKRTTVVRKVKHTKASRIRAQVTCEGCTYTFNKKTGKVRVKPGRSTGEITVKVTARPVGKKNKAKYRHHVWTRTWSTR